jgi:hypothetical protein
MSGALPNDQHALKHRLKQVSVSRPLDVVVRRLFLYHLQNLAQICAECQINTIILEFDPIAFAKIVSLSGIRLHRANE